MQEYIIIRHIATISTQGDKTKELNLISYNGGPPVLDLRSWKPDHQYTSRGVTLDTAEIRRIAEALAGTEGDS